MKGNTFRERTGLTLKLQIPATGPHGSAGMVYKEMFGLIISLCLSPKKSSDLRMQV